MQTSQERTERSLTLLKGCHTRPQERGVMSKPLIINHFNLMLPLGSEDLVPFDSTVVLKCRFCDTFPLNACKGPRCMGPLPGGLPDDLSVPPAF